MFSAAEIITKYRKSIKDDYSIVEKSHAGVDAGIFFELVDISGINRNILAEDIFDVSIKTMLRYQKERKKLNPRHSEIALKVLGLFEKGIEVFGSMKAFTSWLDRPAYGLGGKSPITLMNTNTGIDLVEEELMRIEFGALA
jgi:putative toxin-antitoxin system antitoxin component (TIGR02293 family)